MRAATKLWTNSRAACGLVELPRAPAAASVPVRRSAAGCPAGRRRAAGRAAAGNGSRLAKGSPVGSSTSRVQEPACSSCKAKRGGGAWTAGGSAGASSTGATGSAFFAAGAPGFGRLIGIPGLPRARREPRSVRWPAPRLAGRGPAAHRSRARTHRHRRLFRGGVSSNSGREGAANGSGWRGSQLVICIAPRKARRRCSSIKSRAPAIRRCAGTVSGVQAGNDSGSSTSAGGFVPPCDGSPSTRGDGEDVDVALQRGCRRCVR